MAKKAIKPGRAEVRAAFQKVYDGLTQAYWAASTIEAKDRIYGAEEIIFDVLMDMDRAGLESNTEVFEQVAGRVEPVLKKLDLLKNDLDKLIHAVKVAADVAACLDKALKLAAKYFGI